MTPSQYLVHVLRSQPKTVRLDLEDEATVGVPRGILRIDGCFIHKIDLESNMEQYVTTRAVKGQFCTFLPYFPSRVCLEWVWRIALSWLVLVPRSFSS